MTLAVGGIINKQKKAAYKGKVMKLRTPGKFGHTFANSGSPDETAQYEPSHQVFIVCLVDYFLFQ